jgi:uncharacterized protein (DUF2147 family)
MATFFKYNKITFLKSIVTLYFVTVCISNTYAQNENDKILGKWMSAAKDMTVEVYKSNGCYQAKVIWFVCDDGYVMSDFKDKKNPNVALRSRPWLGMNVLENLVFLHKNEWGKGKIYDPNSGNTFSSVCHLEGDKILKVRGYWLYEWMGKNLTFHRVEH